MVTVEVLEVTFACSIYIENHFYFLACLERVFNDLRAVSAVSYTHLDYRMPTKILIEDVLSIGTVKDDTISQRLQKFYSDTTLVRLLSDV